MLHSVFGHADQLVMAEGLPRRFDAPVRSISFIGDSMAFVTFEGQFGDKNLLVLGPAGDELARLGTSCGEGYIDGVIEVKGEIRAIEVTSGPEFQATLDLDSFTLERVAEWR